jgi:Holliday junction resolvasome RuvABC endonuclease subunit
MGSIRMKIVGVDPSLSNFGFAIGSYDLKSDSLAVSEIKLVRTAPGKVKGVRKNSDDLQRARAIFDEFEDIFHGASMAFVEIPVGSQSARAMASYGICVGLLASIDVPLIQVTPFEVKLAATGNKNATKDEMIQYAASEYPNLPWAIHAGKLAAKNEHCADACAAIKAGVATEQFRAVTAILDYSRLSI